MWTILDDDEERPLWGGSDVGWGLPPESYVFPSPSDGYTFANPAYYEGNDEFESLLADVFVACLGGDPFMYVLDWQHTCYKYNPYQDQEAAPDAGRQPAR